MAKAHPGFKAVQKKIEGEGYSKGAAGAILAKSTRDASPAAKKANPHLKAVAPARKHTGSVGREVEKRLNARDKRW